MNKSEAKKLRIMWIECLGGKDTHSILNQILKLLWSTASYRTINEARRYARSSDNGGVELSGMVHRLLDGCFWESQILAIRRVVDNGKIEPLNTQNDRSVISLLSLIADMKKHKDYFTRRTMLEAEGIDYDTKQALENGKRLQDKMFSQGTSTYAIPDDADPFVTIERQVQIDNLVGCTCSNRDREDSMSVAILEKLESNLKATTESFKTWADKFIAHAATPGSRASKSANEIRLSLQALTACQESICKVANFIGTVLLNDAYQEFMDPKPIGLFDYIERPLIDSEKVHLLQEYYESFADKVNSWKPFEISELLH